MTVIKKQIGVTFHLSVFMLDILIDGVILRSFFNFLAIMITLNVIRTVLVSMGYLSDEQNQKISDEQFMMLDFAEDLNMDSLDFIILLQYIEDARHMSLADVNICDCHTVGDLVRCVAE